MKGMDIKGQNKSRGSGELSNGNPLWKSQITGKTEPPPFDPPLDVNNNNVAEEGGGVAPQGEKNVGVDDEGLLLSNMEDIADLLDDDCPSPRQTREGGEAEDKDGDEEHGEEEEEGKTKELEQKGEEKEVEKKKQMEEFSLATSLSSQDIGGHREPPRGTPDEDEVVLTDEAVWDGVEDGNEVFSGPKTLSSLDTWGRPPPNLSKVNNEGSMGHVLSEKWGNFSPPKTLPSRNDGAHPAPYLSMANNDEGIMKPFMDWQSENGGHISLFQSLSSKNGWLSPSQDRSMFNNDGGGVKHEEENGEILSMAKSLSSQVDGVHYPPYNMAITDKGRSEQYWDKNLKIGKSNKMNIIKKTKKKFQGRCWSKTTKRSCGKKQGRGNIKKQIESMRNVLHDLKVEVNILKKGNVAGRECDNGNGLVVHLLTVGTVEDMKKKGREFTKALRKIVKYVMFGSIMAAIGYMAGSTTGVPISTMFQE